MVRRPDQAAWLQQLSPEDVALLPGVLGTSNALPPSQAHRCLLLSELLQMASSDLPSDFHFVINFCYGRLIYSLTGPCTYILTSDHTHTSSLILLPCLPPTPHPTFLSFCLLLCGLTRASCKRVGIVLATRICITSSGYITVDSDFFVSSSPRLC